MRTAKDAVAWGKAQITNPSQDWYRCCLMFVRMCFGVSAMFPDAGTAWDNAKKKHKTSNPMAIPRGVPVFFETPGVADHVVVSLGDGLCISTDIARRGQVDICKIADIVTRWNAPLLGWTEDLNGVTVYDPTTNTKSTPNITAALKARTNDKRVEALNKVAEHGSAAAKKAAAKWIEAINEVATAQKKADAAKAALTRLERH